MPRLRNLRRLRERAMLSQQDLAEISGVSRDAIARLETTDRSALPSTGRKLAKALEVSPAELIGDADQERLWQA